MIPHRDFQAEVFLRDVLGATSITRNGDELTHACLLPFGNHANDHINPAASLNASKLLYNCFKCGAGGSLIWAVETILGLSAGESRRLIEDNLKPTNVSKEQLLMEFEKYWAEEPAETMPIYSVKMLEKWQQPTRFLDERGVSREVQQQMRTGINLENMDPIQMQSGERVMLKQPRLVLPHIFDEKLRGWTMRKLDNAQIGDKWRHTPRFPKDYTIYNYDAQRGASEIIVVESPMSVLRLKTIGIHNVVATFGAEVTDNQISLLSRFKEVVWFPDGDSAGYCGLRKFNKRGRDIGVIVRMRDKVNLWVVDHGIREDGSFNEKDAADYTKDEVELLLSKKVPAVLWRWNIDGLSQMDKGSARQRQARRS